MDSNLRNEQVENIMDLVEWFEEYQPGDLDHIERVLLGLKFVNSEVVESKLKRDMYRKIKLIKSEKYIKTSHKFIHNMFIDDVLKNNNR